MKIKTTKRFYRITAEVRDDGFTPIYWRAEYRSLNPRTGNEWQASRSVPGWDAYCKTRGYGDVPIVVLGPLPPNFNDGSWVRVARCFSTEQAAVDAVHAFDPESINFLHL